MLSSILLPMPADRRSERLARCTAGLVCFGIGIRMFVVAHLGLAPWDVFHQGVGRLIGLDIGWVIEIVGIVLLLAWIPLRQRVGVGTVLNAVVIGLVVDLTASVLPATDRLLPRVGYVIGGLVTIGIGSGLYLGAGLGAGPRDGLMVGLADRGISVRVARTAIEAAVLATGLALGGAIGVGTLAFAVGIGPVVHRTIPRLQMRRPEPVLSTGSAPL
jgi:uncharacterized membrane protein YczE